MENIVQALEIALLLSLLAFFLTVCTGFGLIAGMPVGIAFASACGLFAVIFAACDLLS